MRAAVVAAASQDTEGCEHSGHADGPVDISLDIEGSFGVMSGKVGLSHTLALIRNTQHTAHIQHTAHTRHTAHIHIQMCFPCLSELLLGGEVAFVTHTYTHTQHTAHVYRFLLVRVAVGLIASFPNSCRGKHYSSQLFLRTPFYAPHFNLGFSVTLLSLSLVSHSSLTFVSLVSHW